MTKTKIDQLEKEKNNLNQVIAAGEGYCSQEMSEHIVEIGAELKGRKQERQDTAKEIMDFIRTKYYTDTPISPLSLIKEIKRIGVCTMTTNPDLEKKQESPEETKMEQKSILEEIYKMDIDTLRKYCIDLLGKNAEYWRKERKQESPEEKRICKVCKRDYQIYGTDGICDDCMPLKQSNSEAQAVRKERENVTNPCLLPCDGQSRAEFTVSSQDSPAPEQTRIQELEKIAEKIFPEWKEFPEGHRLKIFMERIQSLFSENKICVVCGFPENMERKPVLITKDIASFQKYEDEKCYGCGHQKSGWTIKPVYKYISKIYNEKNKKIAEQQKEIDQLDSYSNMLKINNVNLNKELKSKKQERQATAREILNIIGQSPMGVIDEDKFKEIKRIGGLE